MLSEVFRFDRQVQSRRIFYDLPHDANQIENQFE